MIALFKTFTYGQIEAVAHAYREDSRRERLRLQDEWTSMGPGPLKDALQAGWWKSVSGKGKAKEQTYLKYLRANYRVPHVERLKRMLHWSLNMELHRHGGDREVAKQEEGVFHEEGGWASRFYYLEAAWECLQAARKHQEPRMKAQEVNEAFSWMQDLVEGINLAADLPSHPAEFCTPRMNLNVLKGWLWWDVCFVHEPGDEWNKPGPE
jgi:hypothetical protein